MRIPSTAQRRHVPDNRMDGRPGYCALRSVSTTGVLSGSFSTPSFTIVTGLATGIPVIAAPSLAAQTTSISSNTNFVGGPHTIRVEFTQTDVPSLSAGGLAAQLASTLTANLLVNGNLIESVTISNYANANNTAFGTTTGVAPIKPDTWLVGWTAAG
jgi:hypothetical protein